ncbi:MAG: haloacid dehalogenase type II [Chloroflexota bacterium]
MSLALGFDVYGTLVDPLQLDRHLEPLAGDRAGEFARQWRTTQLEYTFRRSLMRDYANFDVCTEDALRYTLDVFDIDAGEDEIADLLGHYRKLDPYPEVISGLERLKERGHSLFAFSNGTPASLESLLSHAGILDHLEAIISVDAVGTYKPDPAVYRHLGSRAGRSLSRTWLVSSNYWDVMGAKAAGLQAAWVRRSPANVPDPWGMEPDLITPDLDELAEELASAVN